MTLTHRNITDDLLTFVKSEPELHICKYTALVYIASLGTTYYVSRYRLVQMCHAVDRVWTLEEYVTSMKKLVGKKTV